ncbi:hypothetical protein FC79_GL001540 [Lentilactobacillus buchneri DSM 20057]|nr:hypothetical protein FC79_GL001540 [Lentilactobacillus buchneri DSM 20057]
MNYERILIKIANQYEKITQSPKFRLPIVHHFADHIVYRSLSNALKDCDRLLQKRSMYTNGPQRFLF